MDFENKFFYFCQGKSKEWLDSRLLDSAVDGYMSEARALIKAGANVNAIHPRNGWNVLMFAAFYYHTDIVDLLLQKGANINATNRQGQTALMRAIHDDNYCPYKKSWGALAPYRLLSAMPPEERQFFANISAKNNTLVTEFNQALKNSANKIYNIIMPSLIVHSNSVLLELPAELLLVILQFQAATQDFPDWYQHRIESDLKSTIDFVREHKSRQRPPVIFSPNALGAISKKRKAENELENKENKKMKLDETEVKSSYFTYCSIQ